MIEDLTDRALGRTSAPVVLSRPASRTTLHEHLAAIVENSDVDELPQPAGGGKSLKRTVLKLTSFSFRRQSAVNRGLVGIVNGVVQEFDYLHAELEQVSRRSAAAIAAFESSALASNQHHRDLLERLSDRVTKLQDVVASSNRDAERTTTTTEERIQSILDQIEDLALRTATKDELSELATTLSNSADELRSLLSDAETDVRLEASRRLVVERQVGLLREEMERQLRGDRSIEPNPELESIATADLSEVYERFEAHFRPAGADLLERFRVYLEDLEYLSDGPHQLLDIGTGRGDFLTVLQQASIPARGIDLNPEAVNNAKAKGLDVLLVDASTYLADLPSESVGAVSALHVVEHLDPETLIKLIDEVQRILIPGGVVIFETPNPTNLVVGASSFYHDPTHHRPVTPDYLSFLLTDRGFGDVRTKFLNPLPEFSNAMPALDQPGFRGLQLLLDDVRWALKGPQDYAVIARRAGIN